MLCCILCVFTFCSVKHYPGEEILSVLSRNRRVGENLIADVIDQSADILIDGVTSGML